MLFESPFLPFKALMLTITLSGPTSMTQIQLVLFILPHIVNLHDFTVLAISSILPLWQPPQLFNFLIQLCSFTNLIIQPQGQGELSQLMDHLETLR